MLYLDQPIYTINGLQIHRDFQNPNQFYYFPGAPRIHRRDGVPAFQLLKYARDVTDNPLMPPEAKEQVGGAFLVFTVDIGVDETILEDTKNQLSAFADGEVSLAPVQFHTGAVRLLALGAPDDSQENSEPTNVFVEKIYGATKPTLYGDNLAIFGLHLKQEGATLLEDSFRHGGGLLGVVYDMTYAGIRPALEVKAKVDYKRVYNHFEANLQFQYAMIGAEIGAQLQWLREQGAIEIEITQYDTDPKTATELRKEAMDLIKQEVLAKMFKPSLQAPQSLTRSQGSLMEQVMRFANQLNRPSSGGSGGSGGSSGPTGTVPGPANRVTEGDAGPSAMNAGQGNRSQSGAAGAGGGTGSTPGFALTFSLKYLHQEERKTAEFDFRISQAVNRNASPQGSLQLLLEDVNLDNHIREVNLDDRFFDQLDAHIGVTGDWNRLGIDQVVINATYQPDPTGPIVHTDGWTFRETGEALKPFNVILDKNRPIRRYNYKTEVVLKDLAHVDSKQRILAIEAQSEQRELLINPSNELRPLLVKIEPGTIDFAKVPRVDVSLRYEDATNSFMATQNYSFRSAQDGPYEWILYPVNPDLRDYQVTYGYTLRNEEGGTSYFEVGPETQSHEGIIAPPPFKGTRRVYVTPAVDTEAIREITVEIAFERGSYRFHRMLHFTASNLDTQTIDIPIPDPQPETDTYKARWSILTNTLETHDTNWAEFQGSRLLVDDGIHTLTPVRVELWDPPIDLGLTSVRLILESLSQDGDIVDTDRETLRGEEQSATFNLLHEKGTPLRYHLRYTTRATDGTRRDFGPEERSDSEVYLDLEAA